MSRDAIKTLFHPFATGVLATPGPEASVLFLGAEGLPPRLEGFEGVIEAVQPFRPLFRAAERAGLSVSPERAGSDYQASLILLGKHKGANEAMVAEALAHVEVGGLIVVAGTKEDGVLSLRKRLQGLGLELDSLPKYHAVALWFARPADATDAMAALARKPVTIEGGFATLPGLFSHEGVDGGSEMLAGRLPTDFDGNVADLGAGWGYLSVMLGEKSPRVNRIDLYEADFDALACARRNMAALAPGVDARFFWQDVAQEPVKDRYELVVMNPPFHEGHATEPGLGQAFIRAAAGMLKNGGRLLMVANRGLPYEPLLGELFRDHAEVCRNARYKVLSARK